MMHDLTAGLNSIRNCFQGGKRMASSRSISFKISLKPECPCLEILSFLNVTLKMLKTIHESHLKMISSQDVKSLLNIDSVKAKVRYLFDST